MAEFKDVLVRIPRGVADRVDRAWHLARAGGSTLSKVDFVGAMIANSLGVRFEGSDMREPPGAETTGPDEAP